MTDQLDIAAIQEAITEHWGPRCRTKDTDDFPELAALGGGRCHACRAWEQFDALCDALDNLAKRDRELRMKVERMVTQITEASNQARYRRTEIKGHQRRIVHLQAENDRLRAALRPFAAAADDYCDPAYDDDYSPPWAEFFVVGDFRRARAALAKGGD